MNDHEIITTRQALEQALTTPHPATDLLANNIRDNLLRKQIVAEIYYQKSRLSKDYAREHQQQGNHNHPNLDTNTRKDFDMFELYGFHINLLFINGFNASLWRSTTNERCYDLYIGIEGNRPFVNGTKTQLAHMSVSADFGARSLRLNGRTDFSRIASKLQSAQALARASLTSWMFL